MSGQVKIQTELEFAPSARVPTGIDPEKVREIPLTKGLVAIVDAGDYEWLSQWKWYAHKKKGDNTYYARRRGRLPSGKGVTIFMHREILGLTHSDGKIPDHKDRNGLNNMRDNLRVASPSLNRQNSKMLRNNTSGYRGVYWDCSCNKWSARISVEGKRIFGGLFSNKIETAIRYDTLVKNLRNSDIPLNFPE